MASANQVSTNQQKALSFLSAMKPKFKAGLWREGTATFCTAYALEPLLCIRELVDLPTPTVQTVVSTLEEWCALFADHESFGDMLQRLQIRLTWEQVCAIVLSPDLAPHSHQALCAKGKYQMQEKRYAYVLITCTRALKIFADGPAEWHAFWISRGLAFLMLKDANKAVMDYVSAYEENPVACQVFVLKHQSSHVGLILKVFYQKLEHLGKKKASAKHENLLVSSKLLQFIVVFEKDPGVLAICASRMMDNGNSDEAIKFLSLAIQRLTERNLSADYLQLRCLRAECYITQVKTDDALEDYIQTVALGEEHTRATLRALSHQQQDTLVARAGEVASNALLRCKQNAVNVSQGELTRTVALFKLLYLINEENVDALYSEAECNKLLGNFSEAIQCFTRFLALRPKSEDALYSAARCHKLLGSFIEAIQFFTRFLVLRPQSEDALCQRAACHLKCGDVQSSLSNYNTALSLKPTFAQGLFGRAWLWLTQDELGKAVNDFASASRVSTTFSWCWNQMLSEKEETLMRTKLKCYLSCALEAKSDANLDEDTLEVSDLLARIWPRDMTCHLLYANVLVAFKKLDEAQVSLVKLMQEAIDELSVTVYLSALRLTQGKEEAAIEGLAIAAKTHGEVKLKVALLNLKEDQRNRISRDAHKRGVKRADKNPDDPIVEMLFTVAVSAATCQEHAWNSYFCRAKVHWRLRNAQAALSDLTSALAIKKDSAEMWSWRALILLHCNNLKVVYMDLCRALYADREALGRFIASQPKEVKTCMMDAFQIMAQHFLRLCKKDDPALQFILAMNHLLVKLDGTVLVYRKNYADALVYSENYQRAAEELFEAERISPENVSVLSRASLVHIILGDVNMCVLKLCRIAKVNHKTLEPTLKLCNAEQKRKIASRSFACASTCPDYYAVLHYTVCISATDGDLPDALRRRSERLGRMRCYQAAIADISAVIDKGQDRVEDLCARADLYRMNQEPKSACKDYIAALELDAVVAKDRIFQCRVTKVGAMQVFLTVVVQEIQDENTTGALELCKYGLQLDPNNAELKHAKKQLKACKKKCVMQ